MPTKTSARWIDDGNNIVKELQAKGYRTDLQYADDDIPNQLAQVENMITKGAKVLVIAAIDGTTLKNALAKAGEAKIKVFAYDRLIRGSANVDYYTTFDNFQVGVLQAQSIVDGLGVAQGKGPFNIELFGGSPDDNNAFFFYNGAMSVLQPLIDQKKLVVSPARWAWTGSARCAGIRPRPRRAWTTCCRATTRAAASTPCCRPTTACRSASFRRSARAGYGTAAQPFPIVSGQDAEIASMKSIIAGAQHSTIFKDTRELAKVTASMIDAV